MIQRIQTVFLALAFIFNLATFFTPLYSHAMDDPRLWVGYGFAILMTIAALASVGCIFLYNNRKNQIAWIKRTMMVQVAAFGWGVGIIFSLGGFGLFLWDELLGAGFLLLALIAQVLAVRYVRKDEELVRSMDRIR